VPRPQGHSNGFSPDVYTALRDIVFPFPKVEYNSQTSDTPIAAALAFGNHTGALTSARSATARNSTCASQGGLPTGSPPSAVSECTQRIQ
jgi:hypothetical protein